MNPEDFLQNIPQMPQGPQISPAEDEVETSPEGPDVNMPPQESEILPPETPEDITSPDTKPPDATPEHTAKENLLITPTEQQEKNEQTTELSVERIKLGNLLESARGLVAVLRVREEERLNPLIEEGELSRFSAAIHDDEELLDVKMASYEEFENVITKMARAVEEIGHALPQRNTKDDPENLQRIIARLKRTRDDTHETGVAITQMEGRPQHILNTLKHLEELLDEKQLFVRKLHNRLLEYMGR